MAVCYISLGSNLGDKEKNLADAIKELSDVDGIRIKKVSSLYRTLPWGRKEQDWFLNQVAEIETEMPPEDLLEECLRAEKKLGRVRLMHWGPRIIDLDILLYDNLRVSSQSLSIPHPYMFQRAFVLVPLAEIAPSLVIEGKSVQQYLAALPPNQVEEVSIWKSMSS
jgi:2-amino-4-hydroxy-6-hydroxymethyldihydropteridine diphosphokinase